MTNKAIRANGSLAQHIKICVDNSPRNTSVGLHHKCNVNGRTRGYKICELHFRALRFSWTTKDKNVNSVLCGGINLSPPSPAYIRQWTRSALVQLMTCPLFGAKPLPELMLVYCQLDLWEQILVKFESEIIFNFFNIWWWGELNKMHLLEGEISTEPQKETSNKTRQNFGTSVFLTLTWIKRAPVRFYPSPYCISCIIKVEINFFFFLLW